MATLSKALGGADDRVPLRTKLRRAQRRRKAAALLLVAPLALFLLVFFIMPLASVLYNSVSSPEVANTLTRTAAALRSWDGESLPDETAYAALVADLREAYANKTISEAATRLNHEISGFRSTIMRAARRADRLEGPPYRDALIATDKEWGEIDYWRALKAASSPYTGRYLAAALDLETHWDGSITVAPPNERIYFELLQRTFWISLVVTSLCIAIGYPIAFVIANAKSKRIARILLILVLLPFWTSLLVRTAAWVVLLQKEGVLNGLLISLGLTDEPLQLIFNRFGVYVAMTHILLPFMILPLYSVMKNIPREQMRAAASLGATPLAAFLSVYLPQTVPGLGAGCLLVFILALGFYVTPALVGGSTDQMISYVIAEFALGTANWGMSSALALVLLVCIALVYPIYHRFIGVDRLKLG